MKMLLAIMAASTIALTGVAQAAEWDPGTTVRIATEGAYPPWIDATADELVEAMFRLTPEQSESIRKNPQEREYRCVDCKRLVGYPEVFYADNRCEACHQAA